MNKAKPISIFFLFVFVVAKIAIGQAGHGTTQETIKNIRTQIKSKFNEEYLVNVYNVDNSSSFSVWEVKKGISDPFNTLDGMQIFLADAMRQDDGSYPNSFIGIYKSGNIIWHSGRDINSIAMVNSKLFGVCNLNKTKKVDIITKWQVGMRGSNVELWITSWDGNSGKWINKIDDQGHSNLKLKSGSIKFIDQEGDGIKEIVGKNYDLEQVLYKWNGQNYVLDGKFEDITDIQVPKNNLQANVSAEVSSKDNELVFNYKIANSKSSQQGIQGFAIETDFKSAKLQAPENWWKIPFTDQKLMRWFISPVLDQPEKVTIKAGKEKSSFGFSSADILPRPVRYYIQGYNGGTNSKEDILTNSIKGITLGPEDYPDPFNPVVVTDSLRSYVSQSCELEWITNRGICKSFDSKLDNIKRQLERGNLNTAANTLQAFLNELEALKEKQISSEAYGLLYYNGQYLLDKLRE